VQDEGVSVGPVIPLSRPFFGDEELQALSRVLASGWVAGQGPEGARLEEDVARAAGRTHAVATSSCTSGLHLVLHAWGLGPGDEVLVADYTYPATAMAVLHTGATPVPVDVDLATGCIDVDRALELVTDRTRALVAVDALGLPADWTRLREAFSGSGIRLLADAACSLGGSHAGAPAGSYGDAAVFSLHARKGATSGEGGVVVTDDATLADDVRAASAFGIRRRTTAGAVGLSAVTFDEVGFNYKLSDLQAAVGVVQVGRLPEALQHRRASAAAYSTLLADLPVTLPSEPEGRGHAWQTYAVLLPEQVDRDVVLEHLRSEGVGCAIGTYSLAAQPFMQQPSGTCPTGERLFRGHLALPMFHGLTTEQQERVAEVLADALAAQS
jgi:perosamine synthetase